VEKYKGQSEQTPTIIADHKRAEIARLKEQSEFKALLDMLSEQLNE